MINERYAPIVITACNRYNKFVELIESLRKNKLCAATNAYIAIDKPKDSKYENEFFKIADYAEKLTCFKNVTVISRTENWGYINNFRDILEHVFEEYDSLIYTEDDNIFSPSFLEYMNECLNMFKEDNRIASIQALSRSPIKTENNIYLNGGMSFWGMGIWKDKWNRILNYLNYDYFKIITHSPRKLFLIWMRNKRRLQKLYVCYVFAGRVLLHDSALGCISNSLGMYSVCPVISLVYNTGIDGEGSVHQWNEIPAERLEEFTRIRISKEEEFQIDIKTDIFSYKYLVQINRVRDAQFLNIKDKLQTYKWCFVSSTIGRIKGTSYERN